MESSSKYRIPVFNVLESTCNVTLAHPKYTKLQKGNKTDRKDTKWICDLFMCDMIKPSFIPPASSCHLRDLMRYRRKLTNMLAGEKNRAQNCLTVSNLNFGKSSRSILTKSLMLRLLLIVAAKLPFLKFKLPLMVQSLMNKPLNYANV